MNSAGRDVAEKRIYTGRCGLWKAVDFDGFELSRKNGYHFSLPRISATKSSVEGNATASPS